MGVQKVDAPHPMRRQRGLRVPNPNSRGHATKRGLRVPSPNSRGHATKRGLRVPNPNSRGPATKRALRVPNPNSRGHTTKRGKEKQERKKERNPAFGPERIWRCTWAGILLRMQDLHFATNDICIVPRLANLALKSTDGLTKRKHTLKKGGAVGTMRKVCAPPKRPPVGHGSKKIPGANAPPLGAFGARAPMAPIGSLGSYL